MFGGLLDPVPANTVQLESSSRALESIIVSQHYILVIVPRNDCRPPLQNLWRHVVFRPALA